MPKIRAPGWGQKTEISSMGSLMPRNARKINERTTTHYNRVDKYSQNRTSSL